MRMLVSRWLREENTGQMQWRIASSIAWKLDSNSSPFDLISEGRAFIGRLLNYLSNEAANRWFSIVFQEQQKACKTVEAKQNLWARLDSFPAWVRLEEVSKELWDHTRTLLHSVSLWHPTTNDQGRLPVWKQAAPSKWILLLLLIRQWYWSQIDRPLPNDVHLQGPGLIDSWPLDP